MALLFWDASALSKRYTEEYGADVVDTLFANSPTDDLASTPWGFAETYSIILRRLNGGVLDQQSFTTAITALQDEVPDNPDFVLFTISDEAIFRSTEIMFKHNLNATDAAILIVVLEVSHSIDAPIIVVVASDKRLLRAAELEGFHTINPETISVSEVRNFLASL